MPAHVLSHALRHTALVTCASGILGVSAGAQGVRLQGRVVTADSTPLRGATITLTALRYSVTTDSTGRFVLAGTPGGTLDLSIAADGYRTETVSVVLSRRGAVNRDFVLVSTEAPMAVAEEGTRLVRGTVTDANGNPIPYANVQLNGGRRVVTNDSGRFSLPIGERGRATLLSRRIGFAAEQMDFDVATDTVVTLRMQSVAQTLPGQTITGASYFASLDLRGFYQRIEDAQKGLNFGYYITPEDLEIRKPLNATDAVQHFPNIQIRPGNAEYTISTSSSGSSPTPLTDPRNMRIEDRSGCVLTVYLDGIRIQPSLRAIGNGYKGDRRFMGDMQDEQINTLIQPGSMAAIEVYPRGLSAPANFQPLAGTCGVVLFWSK